MKRAATWSGCRWAVVLIGLLLAPSRQLSAQSAADTVISFPGAAPKIEHPQPGIKYDLDLTQEKYLVHVPANYTGGEPFGLILYLDPGDGLDEVPADWALILRREKLLLAAPLKSGNDQNIDRRLGLAVLGALKMQERYKIDPQRVYAAGYSGGARMANRLGFLAPDVFHGSIQACGADFYKPVPRVAAPLHHVAPPGQTIAEDYGTMNSDATPQQIEAAKKQVRFVFITGEGDFRCGDIQDIQNGGYAPDGFQSKLMLIPGMGHTPFDGPSLAAALDFIQRKTAPTTKPAPPWWLARDHSQWPQILLTNEIHFKDNLAIEGASGFLMRLADGNIVACTARHVLDEKMKLADVDSAVTSWFMFPPTMTRQRFRLGKLAMNPVEASPSKPLDWLVMSVPAQNSPLPAEPLPARETLVQSGETIYMLAASQEESTAQKIHKGQVLRRVGNEFEFQIDGDVVTGGFTGAPIMDADGQLAALFTARITDQNVPGKTLAVGVDAALVLDSIRLPKGESVTTQKSPAIPKTTLATTPPAAKPVESMEARADAALRAVQPYLDSQMLGKAREKLTAIVQTYPNTPAAEKAAKMLVDLEGK